MNELSKFFTLPLSDSDHRALLHVMGIDHWEFRFIEQLQEQIIQCWELKNGEKTFLLSNEREPSISTIVLNHGTTLSRFPDGLPSTLWEELFPFPLGFLSRFFLQGEKSVIRCEPSEFASDMRKLWTALRDLEDLVGRTEVCCVGFERGEEFFPLLTHSVRRKRVRMGTDPGLQMLRARHRAGELTAGFLRDHFGTHAGFIPVILGEFCLADAIRQALPSYIGPTAPPSAYGELELDAGLR